MTRQYGGHASVKDYNSTRLLNSSIKLQKDVPQAMALTPV